MTPEERSALIAQYGAGYDEVVKALDGFPAASLSAHPIAGKWSAREIIHHLGDSVKLFGFGQMRQVAGMQHE